MTNIENEFWEGMNGIFPDIIKAITSLSSKSYVSITNLKLDEPLAYHILDGSTYNRFTAMAKMLYDSYSKLYIN